MPAGFVIEMKCMYAERGRGHFCISEMAQWVKMLTAKPDPLNSIPKRRE